MNPQTANTAKIIKKICKTNLAVLFIEVDDNHNQPVIQAQIVKIIEAIDLSVVKIPNEPLNKPKIHDNPLQNNATNEHKPISQNTPSYFFIIKHLFHLNIIPRKK